GFAPSLLGHRIEVLEELHARAVDRLLDGGIALKLWILRRDNFIGPAKEQLPILARHPEHFRDHRDRDLRRHVLHEVTLVLLRGLIEHFSRDPAHVRLELLHHTRSELLARDVSVPAVIRRIHVEQVPGGLKSVVKMAIRGSMMNFSGCFPISTMSAYFVIA